MEPFTVLLICLGLFGGAVVLSVALLTIAEVHNWFYAHRSLLQIDKDNWAITIKESLESGRYRVVQGVFNRRTQSLAVQRVIQADALDAELERLHRYNKEVYHTI